MQKSGDLDSSLNNDGSIYKRTKYTIDNPSALDPEFTQTFLSPKKSSYGSGSHSPLMSLGEEIQKDNVEFLIRGLLT